jgi:DNA replicative helicase MCM subunit Mcm2 (Cdc46/Mcm family)
MIISALCPELAGLHVAKIAVALALAGGVARVDARGTTLRGEAHVLLVGDAGTGKVGNRIKIIIFCINPNVSLNYCALLRKWPRGPC